mmetsp:Transcript_30408/g.44996  ORF Transcript_30408/g.44996 Transcript_30408/m.44996 type:complete len:236 (+) Transcript_30408:468-1175(+)
MKDFFDSGCVEFFRAQQNSSTTEQVATTSCGTHAAVDTSTNVSTGVPFFTLRYLLSGALPVSMETDTLTGASQIREANEGCSDMISFRHRLGILTRPCRIFRFSLVSSPFVSRTDSQCSAVLATNSLAMSVTPSSCSVDSRGILGITTGILTDTPDVTLTVGMGEPSKPPTLPLRLLNTMVEFVSFATAISTTTSSLDTCTPWSVPTRCRIDFSLFSPASLFSLGFPSLSDSGDL